MLSTLYVSEQGTNEGGKDVTGCILFKHLGYNKGKPVLQNSGHNNDPFFLQPSEMG